MDLQVISKPGSIKQLVVTVPGEEVKSQYSKLLNDYKGKLTIPGFRKGKAPLSVLEKVYGKAIKEEVREDLIKKYMDNAIKENNLEVLSAPTLTNLEEKEEDAFTFSVEFEVIPEISDIDFKSIKAKYVNEITVSDESINNEIEEILSSYSYLSPIDKPIDNGLSVKLFMYEKGKDGYKGELLDTLTFVVGKALYSEELDEALKGHVAGDEFDFTRDGKTFILNIDQVYEEKLPDFTDDFVKENLKPYESVESYRNHIKELIAIDKRKFFDQYFLKEVVNSIATQTKLEMPISFLMQKVQEHISSMNINRNNIKEIPKEIITQIYLSYDYKFKEELILEKLKNLFNINIEKDLVNAEIDKIAEEQGVDSKELRYKYMKDGSYKDIKYNLEKREIIKKLLENIEIEYVSEEEFHKQFNEESKAENLEIEENIETSNKISEE